MRDSDRLGRFFVEIDTDAQAQACEHERE